jgi:hypothetical protein
MNHVHHMHTDSGEKITKTKNLYIYIYMYN